MISYRVIGLFAAAGLVACQMIPGVGGMMIQHTKVLNASSVPVCKVEIVHIESNTGAGQNAINVVELPLPPGGEVSAEVRPLPEGTTGGTWEARAYTCRGETSEPDVLLGKVPVSDPMQKIVVK